MFNDNQDNQAHNNTDIDQVAKDISTEQPTIGLGANPSTFSPVMPPQAASTPPPPTPTDSSDPVVAPPLGDDSVTTPSPSITTTHPPVSGDLDEIKNQALQQLSPLVSKLDQSPEERYKTLMMLIQASDNHELVKEAYEAANAIGDEALKAEALLGVVNEINYFTQQKNNS